MIDADHVATSSLVVTISVIVEAPERDIRDSLVMMGCRFGSMYIDIMADFSDQICHAVSLCHMVGKTPFWAR